MSATEDAVYAERIARRCARGHRPLDSGEVVLGELRLERPNASWSQRRWDASKHALVGRKDDDRSS